jgi:hypothetical protein
LGEADHVKAASYRSNRDFVITQSNIKRFFDVQEVNIPRPSYDQESQSLPEGGRSVSVGRHGAINPAGAGALFQHKGLPRDLSTVGPDGQKRHCLLSRAAIKLTP